MKQQKYLLNIGLGIVAGLAFIWFIMGTLFDEELTGYIGNYSSAFGILFTMLTPVLSLAIGSIASAFLFFMPPIGNQKRNLIYRILGALGFIAFTAFSIKEGIEYATFPCLKGQEDTYRVLAIVLVALIDIAILLFVKLATKKVDAKKIIPTVLVIFLVIAAWLFVSEVIKHLASRPRPRNVLFDSTYSISFRNWYEFRPFLCFKEGYKDCKSFISGHAFIAATTIGTLPLILSLGKKSTTKTIISLVVSGVFTFLVAFSRVVAYAHYMSDVMGAIIVCCISQAIIFNLIYYIYEKKKK